MKVVATAGHVDHGKSALIRTLTGMEPDRWAEERRRGLTIDLGFAWTELEGQTVAFVDVPGHQRFVSNMLAGVGPVPAVLFVVAADDGWSRQSTEHLDALRAFGIRPAVLAVTKADLVTPAQAAQTADRAGARLTEARLELVETVTVSSIIGTGLGELRAALTKMLERLPPPEPAGPVRLWIDRAFTVRGAGTVVTGTLGAGRIAVGDRLHLLGRDLVRPVTVRAIEQLGSAVSVASAASRVALNLRSIARDEIERGDCLLSPDAWPVTASIDVKLDPVYAELTGQQVLHLGSASVPARLRLFGDDVGRLTLARPLPIRVGERAVLRDPGQQCVSAGITVLDPDPPELSRRGSARSRGEALRSGAALTVGAQVARRGAVRAEQLHRLGFEDGEAGGGVLERAGWLIDPRTWARWVAELPSALDERVVADPRQPWLSTEAARRRIGIPAPELVAGVVEAAALQLRDGRVSRPGTRPGLGRADAAVQAIVARLTENPFAAPERTELQAAGVTVRDLATAAETGLLLRLGPDLVIGADGVERAVQLLAGLAQPFTLSQARQQLGTTRRVAVPLLELLDRQGRTVRDDSDCRRLS